MSSVPSLGGDGGAIDEKLTIRLLLSCFIPPNIHRPLDDKAANISCLLVNVIAVS